MINLNEILHRLVADYSELGEVVGLTMAGSKAASLQDDLSDINLDVYLVNPLTEEKRRQIILKYATKIEMNYPSFVTGDHFLLSDFPVEITVSFIILSELEQELYDVMDELMESARNFKTFNEWFAYIDEYGTKLRESYAAMDKQNAVILTTMHSSKGLEYPVVYIIDANEEITPHKKAVFVPEIEEERRMFYVAMTRAKRRLNIYYARKRYNKEIEVSRFVKEIMEDGLS